MVGYLNFIMSSLVAVCVICKAGDENEVILAPTEVFNVFFSVVKIDISVLIFCSILGGSIRQA